MVRKTLFTSSVVKIMEAYCSFKTLANGPCGHGKKSSSEIISLVSCAKSIDTHLSAHKFSSPVDELDLILCRVGKFSQPVKCSIMTICPNHRLNLGVGWRRGGNTRCRVPKAMSGHGKGGKRWPKAEKGLDKDDSLYIFKTTFCCSRKWSQSWKWDLCFRCMQLHVSIFRGNL